MTRKRKFGLWLSEKLEHLAFKIDLWSASTIKDISDLRAGNTPMTNVEWNAYISALPEYENDEDEKEAIRKDDEEFRAAVEREDARRSQNLDAATVYNFDNPNASWNQPK